ncbi:MAG: response regulator transcription factor, partial [Actinomycetota bacterium]
MSDNTVLIADDHPPTRAGVRAALEAGGFVICAEVGDARSAVEATRKTEPEVALLDIDMPGDGVAAIAPILEASPSTFVVMLTASEDEADLFRSLREGASGYLLKDTDPERLPVALRGVLEGEAALPRTLAALLIEEFRSLSGRRRLPLIGGRRVDLTPREW